jgi:enterochelin esterase-like enzyme
MASLAQRAQQQGTPLIAGDKATFVWLGTTAPKLIGDFNGWGGSDGGIALTQTEPEVWTHTITPGSDAYIEYFYTEDVDDNASRFYDPLNKRRITNGMGKFNNFFTMPDMALTPFARAPKAGVPRGTVTQHTLEHPFILAGGTRKIWLYQPPTSDPVPLLLVYDGRDYYQRAKLTNIVDHLIHAKQIQPIALAMVDHARQARFVEYDHGEAALAGITRLVLPLAQQELHLLDITQHPGAYGVLGASMGGLMALFTGLRLPHIFGTVLSQSGAFQRGFLPDDIPPLIEMMIQQLPPPQRMWMAAGKLEWLLETNRYIHKLMLQRGYSVTYQEYNGGHNYTCWRNTLPHALITGFGK